MGLFAMRSNRNNDFGSGDIRLAIIHMALPMMLAELVNVLYSVVDRVYIGHIPQVGDMALTGLGITIPLVTITTAFASLCGAGGGPLCSIARGEGDEEKAEKIIGCTFSLLVLIGLVLTAGFLLFMDPLLRAFGASDASFPFAKEYAQIYVCGTLFSMLSFGMNFFINAQGFAKMGMLTIAIGAAINIVLDPIFIFALDMGIAGAAIATVIAQLCSATWVLSFLTGRRSLLKLKRKYMTVEKKTAYAILSLGLSGFVMKATTGLVQILYNIQLRVYGGDVFIGCMTIVNSIRDVIFMTFHGLTSGFQPVLGFNYGAKKYDRVRAGIRFSTLVGLGYAAVCWVVLMLFPGFFAHLFTDKQKLLAVCIPHIRIFFAAFVLKSLQMVGQYTFVALGKSRQAVFFSLLRKVIIVVPLIFLLPRLFGLGASGIFWTEPVADTVSSTICYATMYFTLYRRMPPEEKEIQS